jgi:cobalt-zinc-cadmium efflux system outer membrane protein
MKKNRALALLGQLLLPFAILAPQGCSLPGGKVEGDLHRLTLEANSPCPPAGPVDVAPVTPAPRRHSVPPIEAPEPGPGTSLPPLGATRQVAFRQAAKEDELLDEPRKRPRPRLSVPPELPGADAPPISLPEDRSEREKALKALFPPIPSLPPQTPDAPGPEGRPMTLSDLQRLGETYSPAIKTATAAVEAAKGAAVQAGMYPNPTFAFENDTLQTGPAGYPGFFVDQTIKTGGKLKLQQAAALMDVLNARAALRRAQHDLRYSIRGNYFAVLVARENVRVSEALFRFASEIYRTQVAVLEKGFAATYEPMQLRPLVVQAQLAVIQARNQYRASWRQLAANLGLPDMPPSELEGRVDLPVPVYDYDRVRDHAFKNHTDVLTAQNNVRKAGYNLELARVVPLPDVDARLLVQRDYTTPPNQVSISVQVGVPVPVWDQNKGGIRQAEGQLAQAVFAVDQARFALVNTLADAWNRYETARQQVDLTSQQVRDQIRAYRGVYARRWQDPTNVSFGDVVTAQQTLATYVAAYVAALGAQWQAVVDVANVLQTDDLFAVAAGSQQMLTVPDLNDLEYCCCCERAHGAAWPTHLGRPGPNVEVIVAPPGAPPAANAGSPNPKPAASPTAGDVTGGRP